MKFLLGRKLEMSQVFDDKGKVIPVTLVQAGPCLITQIKNEKNDGYQAIQIGFEKIEKKNKIKKTMKGKEYRVLKEINGNEFEKERKPIIWPDWAYGRWPTLGSDWIRQPMQRLRKKKPFIHFSPMTTTITNHIYLSKLLIYLYNRYSLRRF